MSSLTTCRRAWISTRPFAAQEVLQRSTAASRGARGPATNADEGEIIIDSYQPIEERGRQRPLIDAAGVPVRSPSLPGPTGSCATSTCWKAWRPGLARSRLPGRRRPGRLDASNPAPQPETLGRARPNDAGVPCQDGARRRRSLIASWRYRGGGGGGRSRAGGFYLPARPSCLRYRAAAPARRVFSQRCRQGWWR